MGNCIRHEKSSWADNDEWGSLVSTHRQGTDDGEISIMEKEKFIGGKRAANSRVLKITISKKELEKLVQKVDMQGLTLEQVLARMVKGGNVYEEEHHRSWKPVLQSIPEVN
ncbi:uncharacterized protein LOC111280822 [Durio zibethinus]|uniref:Uncharacterized protein LOC111280822 n=1 Tax=Durio zibethinus TaxID=66656 RepID=A0A6P5X7B2_DURZI|nr:uncharacterized protein LOC111280822 [Durio zibethinus]